MPNKTVQGTAALTDLIGGFGIPWFTHPFTVTAQVEAVAAHLDE
jgi:hypothetical protein